MQRILPWVLLAVLAVALVLFWKDSGPSSEVEPPAVGSPQPEAAVELAAVPFSETAPDVDDRVAEDLRVAVLGAPAHELPAISSQGGLWLEVVYAEDGAPAAGAEVQMQFMGQGSLEQAIRTLEAARVAHRVAPAAPFGMVRPWLEHEIAGTLVANSEGRVHIHDVGPWLELRAEVRRQGVLYRGERQLGFGDLTGVQSEFRLEVHRAFEGTVLVLGADGEPVPGVAVVAMVPKEAKLRSTLAAMGYAAAVTEEPQLPEMLAGAVTDAEGRAALLDPSNRVARAIAAEAAVAVEALVLTQVPVRAGLVAGGETVLRLPPLGAVTLELSEDPSSHWMQPTTVALSLEGGGQSPFDKFYRSLDGGRTRFTHVGLGLRLAARVVAMSDHGPYPFDGPTEPGQDLRFVIPENLGLRVVEFQLVNEAGTPLADRGLRVTQMQGLGAMTLYHATNGTGHLRVECGNPRGPATELVLHMPSELRDGSFLRTLEARVDLTSLGPLTQGMAFQDGGVLVMRPRPSLAAGRVVDGSGAPIPGATVDALQEGETPRPTTLRGGVGLRAHTNANGEFLLEGETPGPNAQLVVSARGFAAPEPRPFVPGERGIELALGSAGAVQVALLLPAGLGPDHVRAEVLRGRDAPLPLRAHRASGPTRADQAILGLDKLAPGPWALEVHSVADDLALVRMDFEVPSAGTMDLGEIDLTQKLFLLEVRASRADGRPARSVNVRRVDGERSIDLRASPHEPVLVPKPPDGAVLEISASGCLPKRATVSGPLLEVTLEMGLPARLVLPPGLPLPSKRLPVGMAFGRLSDEGTQSASSVVTLEASSEYIVHLGAPGRFELRFLDFTGALNSLLMGPTGRFEFEVRAVDLEQNLPVELPVDVAVWTEMLKRHDSR